MNPFRGKTVTPFDLLISQQGWHAVNPDVRVRNYERSDPLDTNIPRWTNARKQLRSGHMPYWDDVAAGGDASFLNLTGGMLTPDFVIFTVAPDPADGFYLAILFNLIVAGLGMHLFLRKHFGLLAAFTGAVTFMLCGFHTAWLYWPHVRTSIWLPWLLLAIEACAARPRMRTGLAVGLASAMVVLGGFPFVGMLILEAGGLYVLAWAFVQWRHGQAPWRLLGWYAAGSVFAFLLCAIPLAQFIMWLGQYEIGYRHGGSLVHLRDWKLLFAPWSYMKRRVEFTMYDGTVMTVLSVLAFVGLLFRWRRNTVFSSWSIILLVASAGFVFGFWPMWLVGKLPGMSSNVWTRAIIVLDLAIICLGAWAIDWLWTRRPARWGHVVRFLVLALALIQLADQGMFFRAYNGAVPKRYYYPETGAIQFLSSHTGPFDYVIADKSYLISGTLGTYGLREWFAHKFKSPPLRDALMKMAVDPLHSPTSSRLNVNQIRVDSPDMATFNVRYLAVQAGADIYARMPPKPKHARHVALPALPEHHWVQPLVIKDPQVIRGLSVRLATYHQSNLQGTVRLTAKNPDGEVVATVQRPAKSIRDNAMERFDFAQPLSLQAGRYTITLDYDRDGGTRPITAWAFKGRGLEPPTRLVVDGKKENAALDYRLHENRQQGAFRRVYSDGSVDVLANMHSPGGPYFLGALDQTPTSDSAKDVHLADYRAEKFGLRYDGAGAGYVIVPMEMTSNWYVTVNGKSSEGDVALKDGLMPAVHVSGPSNIEFAYHPRVLNWIYAWLGGVVLSLALMYMVDRRLRNSRRAPAERRDGT